MTPFRLIAVLFVIFGFASPLRGGVYSPAQKGSGIFLQNDRSNPLRLDADRTENHTTCAGGTLSAGTGRSGTYIRTDRHGRLHIDRQDEKRAGPKLGDADAARDDLLWETETKVRINGNQVLVPVALGYQGKEKQALFLLDTGASIVVIHRDVAELLGIRTDKSADFMVAGGRTLSTDVAVLNYVGVGTFRKEKLRAAVIDHRGGPISYQGLLGMNFLRHFQYRINFKRQVIVWSR